MALHGTIMINGNIIGAWVATRQQRVPREVNDYEVEVTYIEPDEQQHTVRTTISHRFGDGAVTLAAEVLAWAAPLLPPRASG